MVEQDVLEEMMLQVKNVGVLRYVFINLELDGPSEFPLAPFRKVNAIATHHFPGVSVF